MQPKPSKLGRGLSALLTPNESTTLEQSYSLSGETKDETDGSIRYVPLKKIRPGKWQPRQRFNDQDIEHLAHSIQQNGVLQPILVHYQAEDDSYHIIAGERRWRAALRAQLAQIPVLIKSNIQGTEALTIALVENVQRADLSAIEEAHGYERLMEAAVMTQEKVAELVGKSRSHVANILRLLQLPKSIQDILQNLEISPGHARCLIGLSESEALAIIDEIIHKKLNVRQVERLIKQKRGKAPEDSQKSESLPHEKQPSLETPLSELESLALTIEAHLGLPARLVPGKKGTGGEIILHFTSFEELDGFLNRISKVNLNSF